MGTITLNDSDFQCLQDQIVELKTKNYELAEKNRRSQADFEAAKAKICSLQMKLEEQERDFQVTSTTLRREIETAYSLSKGNGNGNRCANETSNNESDERNKDEDYKTKYKKLLLKAKELQQRYEKSVEVVQQMDNRIKILTCKAIQLEEENAKLKSEFDEKQKQSSFPDDDDGQSATDEANSNCHEHLETLDLVEKERATLKAEVERLSGEVIKFNNALESEAEERKIQKRKNTQMVKELKRQLAMEKNQRETLQKRLENLLTSVTSTTTPVAISNAELDSRCRLSETSSTNGQSNSSNGTSSQRANNLDANSVSSWSLVAGKTRLSNQALNESLSICSIESEDRETVQQPKCDTKSDSSLHPVSSSSTNVSANDLTASPSLDSSIKTMDGLGASLIQQTSNELLASTRHDSSINFTNETNYNYINNNNNINNNSIRRISIKEQAALIERLTHLQHDKWSLEEKLSYLEQANSAMTEELANKSHIIKNYFMDQALRSVSHQDNSFSGGGVGGLLQGGLHMGANLRKGSLTSNVNQLLLDKPGLKKVVDFLKDKSQVSSCESESISREATKKMQLMLEETLIKCLKLQENLDSITIQLNKLER